MSEAEAKIAIGKRTEISEKGDWTSFHVDIGKQYPLRLSTKVKAVIDAAREFGTDQGAWYYKESQGNENPNKPGTFYTNRYLDKVEPVDETVASPGTVGKEAVDWEGKERRIVRQACLKVAVAMIGELPPNEEKDSVVSVMGAAQRFENWVYRGFGEAPF